MDPFFLASRYSTNCDDPRYMRCKFKPTEQMVPDFLGTAGNKIARIPDNLSWICAMMAG